jgi:endonuclease V-like protein UPF0215 family
MRKEKNKMDDIEIMIKELNELFSDMRVKTRELKQLWKNERIENKTNNIVYGDNYIIITWKENN